MQSAFLGILFCLLLPLLSYADAQSNREQLLKVKKRIEQASDSLNKQKSAEKDLLRDLSVVATTIKRVDSSIKLLKKQKQIISKNLASARKSLQETQKQLNQLEVKINKRLVALYKEGEVGPLRLFFSSESPMELVQQYQSLTLVLEHDRQLLNEFRTGLEQQKKAEQQYAWMQAKQERLLDTEQKSREDAAQGRKLYRKILAKVRQDKKRLSKNLSELESRAKRLKQLVTKLKAEDQKQQSTTGKHFAGMRGALPWPVQGTVAVGFGTQHNEELGSVLESHGVEIEFNKAQPVRAVGGGRIVFSSWFKGYGNLMIIAHDKGYHTLYAQIDRLDKSVGDVVQQGDSIAQTGSPGGQGIYFEIRHNGSPIDPMLWLRSHK